MACFVVVVSTLALVVVLSDLAFTESEHTAKDTITSILILKTRACLQLGDSQISD